MTIENEILEMQAKVLVEELLLRRHTLSQIQSLMARHDLRLTKADTNRIVKLVKAEWANATEEVREERRDAQRRSLENLYRTAFADKKYSVCLGVERLLAELDGTMAPKRVQVSTGNREEDEFDDRSEVELEYFSKHGYYPDEDPNREQVH